MSEMAEPHRDLDASALRALAHPLRVEIFDILSQYGPQTASSLAEMTGESSGSTSYHLRALAKHELIREVDGRGTARERWWERPRGSITIGSPEAARTPAGRAAMQVVNAEFLARRQQLLTEYMRVAFSAPEPGAEDHSVISTAAAGLTHAQAAELIERISAIVTETVERYRDQEGPDVHRYTIRNDIFPIDEIGAQHGAHVSARPEGVKD